MKCPSCGGEGSLEIRGSLKVCKVCNGLGKVLVSDEAQRVLRRFQQSTDYTVHHGHSTILKYDGPAYLETIYALQALSLSGIKAQIVFPI